MRDTLYIRWRDDPQQLLRYAIVLAETPDEIAVHEGTREAVRALAGRRRVVLMVDADSVQILEATVPTRQASKLLQAVPYLLEDQLADDVDTLHFALGKGRGPGGLPVAIVARSTIDSWLAPFRALGIQPDAVVPETLCLPQPAEGDPWPMLVEPSRLTIRHGAFAGFSCAPDELPAFLAIAEKAAGAHALRAFVVGDSVPTLKTGMRPVQWYPGFEDPLQILIRNYKPASAINLLQGAYSRRENLQRAWRPWRVAASLLLAVFALAWLTNAAYTVRLGHEARVQELANTERFHQLFPNAPRSLALSLAIRQVAARADNAGIEASSGEFLPLLQQTASGLTAIHSLSVTEMQFHDHALYANLVGDDLQSLDRLRRWFSAHRGVHLDVRDASAKGKKMHALIKITAG